MLRFDEFLKQIYNSKSNPSNWIGLVLFSNWLVQCQFDKSFENVANYAWFYVKMFEKFFVLSFFKVSLVRALKNVGSQFGRWNATISHFMKCLTPPFFRSWDDAFQSHSQRKQPFRMYMWSLSILLRNKVKSRERISHDFPYIFSIWGFSRFLFSFLGKGKSLIMRQHFRHENSKPSLPT